ncbi:MAG TPA: sugar ABC transporter substrate-binding protein [Devosiaceae bacterium]|jgi:multiple sugar transport system substrate-binding protein
MNMPKTIKLAALALSTSLLAVMPALSAETLSIWVRASGANAAQHMVDLWNTSHDDKLEMTIIPDNQMVTKLATGVQAGDVPDLISFDLIYMPDFMKAGFLNDLTADLKDDPNYQGVAQAYKDIATYDGKIYGAGFTPDVSILVWNKDLFKKAGLDPDKGPTTVQQLHEYAAKIHALGDDIYGFYFSGACPGCNIFATSPMMVAGGAKILPTGPDDEPLTGDAIKTVLTEFKAMWDEGLVPESAEADNGQNFVANFSTGKIGIQGAGGFLISDLKANAPQIDFGVGFLPGVAEGQTGAFVGGDVIAVPKGSRHADLAKQFIKWELTDEAQLEGLARNSILPSRPSLADNKYFAEEPRVVTTAKALAIGYTPYALHFNDMVNSDSSPWIQMLQTAVFDGDVDGAIATAKEAMAAIAAN